MLPQLLLDLPEVAAMVIARLSALSFCCLILAGCSDATPKLADGVTVSGKVFLPSGAPLSGGTLLLRPESGLFGATSQIQNDGSFKLQNANTEAIAPGKYQVFVRFSDASQARLKSSVNPRYQQNGDDGDSDVVVEIQQATTDLAIRLKR